MAIHKNSPNLFLITYIYHTPMKIDFQVQIFMKMIYSQFYFYEKYNVYVIKYNKYNSINDG